MSEWTPKTQGAVSHPKYNISIPERHYEELELADGSFCLRILEDEDILGLFYPYFVRMSGPGPLGYKNAKNISGSDKEAIKRISLAFLKERLKQALQEIEELEAR